MNFPYALLHFEAQQANQRLTQVFHAGPGMPQRQFVSTTQTYSSSEQAENLYNLDSTFALLGRSICRPFRARRSGWRFPGLKPKLKPWAEWREDNGGSDWFSPRKGRCDSARLSTPKSDTGWKPMLH
jgi:hypothetical protein